MRQKLKVNLNIIPVTNCLKMNHLKGYLNLFLK